MSYDYRDISCDIDRLNRGNSSGRSYRTTEIDLVRLENRGNSDGRLYRVITTGSVSPAAEAEYVNRCWHYSNAEFVYWTTTIDPDPTGASYPGPGVFGVDTTTPAVVVSYIPA